MWECLGKKIPEKYLKRIGTSKKRFSKEDERTTTIKEDIYQYWHSK